MLSSDFSSLKVRYGTRALVFRNILRILAYGSLVAMMLLAAFFVGIRQVKAASATCYDITGQGKQVLVNGIPNSGVIHFDAPLAPDTQYEACVEDTGVPLGNGPFQVKGWAWDTNLGWISFYCADENLDGPPYENLGVPCGNEKYGVMMEGVVPTGGFVAGQLHGYAWGDNSGWINFSCSGGVDDLGGACGAVNYGVIVETVDPACYGEVFGSTLPDPSCSANAPEDTYIFPWSDNVGWFNLEGVQLPWIDLTDAGVVVSAYLEPDPTDPAYVVPIGDGVDSYKLRLVVTKTSGAPIDPADYTFDIGQAWLKNTVYLDQTSTVPGMLATSVPTTEAEFNLTSVGTGGYGQDGVANAFTAFITSSAPTSEQNYYQMTSGQKFPNQIFIEGDPYGGATPLGNSLRIGDLTVSVKRVSDGLCVYGDIFGGCAQSVVTNYAPPADLSNGHPYLGFKPAIDLPIFENQTTDGDAIQAAYKLGQEVKYKTECRGIFYTWGTCGDAAIQFSMGVDTPEFLFVADFAGDNTGDATCADPTAFSINTELGWSLSGDATFIITPVFQPDGSDPSGCKQTGPESGEGAYLYSKVTYHDLSGRLVSYYSSKLPRVTGTLVVNPVATVKGSVYSTGVTNPQEGASVRSIGDVSTNILRDTIFKNVSNIIAGAPDTNATAVTLSPSAADGGFSSSGGDVAKLLLDKDGVAKVYYKHGGDIVFSNGGSDIDWTGQRTVIVVGANIYIDDNLYNASAASAKPRLGIISLRDLTSGKGGNVYIHPDVTDIQANIFADGSVFSYTGDKTLLGDKDVPCWANEKTRHDTLINQLYFEGSIASQNTIGGAADVTPTLGNGKKTTAAEGTYGVGSPGCQPWGRSQARLYDLNFLRYYGLVFERDPVTGNAVDQNSDGVITAQQVPAGDLVLPTDLGTAVKSQSLDATDLNAVYVFFDPPPATLPGFGVVGGVDVTVRPQ